MDSLIPLAVALFILSMINERIVNFIKLQFSDKKLFWIPVGNLKTKLTDGEEDDRNKRLILLNIIIGTLVSIGMRADLITIMSHMDHPQDGMGWKNFDYNTFRDWFTLLPGCFLTGCFLSLGSKFWHDILDLLLYTKNLKGKLADDQTYTSVTSADQLTEFVSLTDADMVRLAIEQNGQLLKTKYPNIEFLNDSIAIVNGVRKDVLGIYVRDANTQGMPDKVPVKLPSGKTWNVSTEIISDIGTATITAMDGPVSNIDLNYNGSACCILNDGTDNYLLTNGHVLTGGDLGSPLYDTGAQPVAYNSAKMGTWYYGSMTTAGDFALVKITNMDTFADAASPETFTAHPRKIIKDDNLHLQVTTRGTVSKARSGYVIDTVNQRLAVPYGGGTIIFDTAILIGDRPDSSYCQATTQEGDSGGAVYDGNMNLIGIITARSNNGRFTYAIPVADFINSLKLKMNKI